MRHYRSTAVLPLVALMTGLTGCGMFSSDPPPPAGQDGAAPADQRGYPNLGTVPARPRTSTAADRAVAAGQLTSDRARARYGSDVQPVDETRGATIGTVVRPKPPEPEAPPVEPAATPPGPAPMAPAVPPPEAPPPPAPEPPPPTATPPTSVPVPPPTPTPTPEQAPATPPRSGWLRLPSSPVMACAPAGFEASSPAMAWQPEWVDISSARSSATPASPIVLAQVIVPPPPVAPATPLDRLGEGPAPGPAPKAPPPVASAPAIVPPPAAVAPATPLERVGEGPGTTSAPKAPSTPAPRPAVVTAGPRMADPATATSGATTRPMTPVGGPIQVAVIQFGAGSSALDAGDMAVLRDVARMYSRSGGTVRVYAHSSHDGVVRARAGSAQDVSASRGSHVVDALRRLGVPGAAVSMVAMADARPIYDTSTARGIAANRRAEIFLDF
jgi:outer membrane protein OmpA-like peptidoglycan-associated protein